MAIQNRRGAYSNYDPNKMVSGEFAVATDEQKLFIAFAPGLSKRILTEDDSFSGTLTATNRGSGVVELSIT